MDWTSQLSISHSYCLFLAYSVKRIYIYMYIYIFFLRIAFYTILRQHLKMISLFDVL